MTSAMQAIRSGEAIAAVYIPENFERDLLARQRPQIVTLYNRQYFTPGNNANSSISNAIAAATATLPHGRRRRRLPARRPRCPSNMFFEPGAELRAVPAARDPADRAACRRGDHRRLRGRLGVLAPKQTRVVASRRRSSACRAGRQVRCRCFAIFILMMVVDRRHHPRPVRRLVSRRPLLMVAAAAILIFSPISRSARCWFC